MLRPFRWSLVATAALLVGAGCSGRGVTPPAPLPLPEPRQPAPAEAAPGLPPIPLVRGPLDIRIVHPVAGQLRPNVDSVFIYGSVGTGEATLTINGAPVPVEPNGAFIGFLPRPADDTFRLRAVAGTQVGEASIAYRAPGPPGAGAAVRTLEYPMTRAGVVTVDADTAATGSDVAIGRPTPTGTYRWFLPRGARLQLTGEREDLYRVRLDATTEAWFPKSAISEGGAVTAPVALQRPTLISGARWSDIRLPIAGAPFRVEVTDTVLVVTLHGVTAAFDRLQPADPTVTLLELAPGGTDAAIVRVYPTRRIWGYKTFYEPDGTLVLRVRQPPPLDPANPLRGVRVVVDPGHPPGGATGPTGLSEAEANLGISLRLAEQLRIRGAEVLLTRTDHADVPLGARVAMAVAWDADVLVSVHNNAFPEGVNPYLRNGTSSYYFQGHSTGLARAMNLEILDATRIRDLGALSGNLALVRPSWMPSVLTESLFMPIPQQEAALRNSLFLERLADAHVRGLERFLRESAGPTRPAVTGGG